MTDARTTKGARRRAQLIAEARSHLVDVGVERFSVRQVADAAGITLGNLQYYFPTRDDLLAAVMRAEIDADAALIRSLQTDDPAEELAAVVGALLDRWRAGNDRVYEALVLLTRHRPDLAELTASVWSTAYDEVAAIVGRIDPEVGAVEARARAMLIVSLIDGASLQHYADGGRLSRRSIGRDIVGIALAVASGAVAGEPRRRDGTAR
jgi:AcrR family transcriptional regulator